MAPRPLHAVPALTAVLLLASGCGDAEPAEPDRGKVFAADRPAIEVAAGAEFSIRVEDNPSTGMTWIVEDPQPDPAVARFQDSRYQPSASGEGKAGAGGTRDLTFRAEAAGQTRIALRRCLPTSCTNGEIRPGQEQDVQHLSYTLTVR
ncbi:protease inhibitor I42 family protein [Kitasatospora sp. NBC_00070]|uniref:protease inhibitor I42 family protein n=1 Tax=Kitasatospora sp. NBC_00070 TaxID=2975962 RepID=UPI0032529848